MIAPLVVASPGLQPCSCRNAKRYVHRHHLRHHLRRFVKQNLEPLLAAAGSPLGEGKALSTVFLDSDDLQVCGPARFSMAA